MRYCFYRRQNEYDESRLLDEYYIHIMIYMYILNQRVIFMKIYTMFPLNSHISISLKAKKWQNLTQQLIFYNQATSILLIDVSVMVLLKQQPKSSKLSDCKLILSYRNMLIFYNLIII